MHLVIDFEVGIGGYWQGWAGIPKVLDLFEQCHIPQVINKGQVLIYGTRRTYSFGLTHIPAHDWLGPPADFRHFDPMPKNPNYKPSTIPIDISQ